MRKNHDEVLGRVYAGGGWHFSSSIERIMVKRSKELKCVRDKTHMLMTRTQVPTFVLHRDLKKSSTESAQSTMPHVHHLHPLSLLTLQPLLRFHPCHNDLWNFLVSSLPNPFSNKQREAWLSDWLKNQRCHPHCCFLRHWQNVHSGYPFQKCAFH